MTSLRHRSFALLLGFALAQAPAPAAANPNCSLLYQFTLKGIAAINKDRSHQTATVRVSGKPYSELKLTYDDKLGSGYYGSVYTVKELDPLPDAVARWDGPVVVKVPNKFGPLTRSSRIAEEEARREVVSLEALQDKLPAIEASEKFPKDPSWTRGTLPVVPILDSADTEFGKFLFKPVVRGKSLMKLQEERKILSPEMLRSLDEIYGLTRAISETTPYVKLKADEVAAHANFHLDINANNLVWVEDVRLLRQLGLKRPSFVMYEMTPLRSRTSQFQDLTKEKLMTELGVAPKDVVSFASTTTKVERGTAWVKRYGSFYLNKDKIPRYAEPGPNPPTRVDPAKIFFMQDACENLSQDGKYTVLENAKNFRNGSLKAESLPPIEVWMDEQGRIWSLDHRRLAAIRLAGNVDQVAVKWAPRELVEHDGFKFATTSEGKSIKVDLGDDRALVVH